MLSSLVRPSDLKTNCIEINVPKRGRPRKLKLSELIKSEIKQEESSKQSRPEDVIQYPLIFSYFLHIYYTTAAERLVLFGASK